MKNNLRHKNKDVLHGAIMGLMIRRKKRLREAFTQISLTEGKPKILDFLVDNSGCSQRELAQCCHIEPATATSILQSMEEEELISRTRNPKDKRVYNVFLTPKGIDMQKKVETIFTELDEKCFQGFSEEEKVEAIRLINKISDNLSKGEVERD